MTIGKLDILAAAIARHAPADGTYECGLKGVKLIRASQPTTPMPVIYEPTVCLVAQGRKQAALGTKSFVYDPAHFLVASVDLPVMGSVVEASEDRPYLCLQLDLDMAELGELAIRYPDEQAEPKISPAGLTLNATSPELLDAAVRLTALLDAPRDLEALGPLTIREMLYRLLTGSSRNVIRHMARRDSRLKQISRAILWIRANFRDACPIDQAADVAGMSRSTFHLHFKAITTMSPLEFRTHLRMQEARRLMVTGSSDAASAGFLVGYESPSQFSRDYSRLFGMPPARHASKLRSTLGGPGLSETVV